MLGKWDMRNVLRPMIQTHHTQRFPVLDPLQEKSETALLMLYDKGSTQERIQTAKGEDIRREPRSRLTAWRSQSHMPPGKSKSMHVKVDMVDDAGRST